MKKIKILMCCHKPPKLVPPLCEAIQCGSAIHSAIPDVLHDDGGKNISEKNREYCELTAHFYVWKNIVADYYGFFHYRRFLCTNENHKRPYLVKGGLSDRDCSELFGDESYWRELTGQYEIIAPRSEDMGISVQEHYCTSRHHFVEDLKLFTEMLLQSYPELSEAAERYLSQNRQYFCNVFIMDRVRFFEYCEILFDVLGQFDKRKTLHGTFQSDRTDGYLGEIFTGIYITHCYGIGIKIKELPRLDINCSIMKRLSCAFFPPESRRRFWIKSLVKKLL